MHDNDPANSCLDTQTPRPVPVSFRFFFERLDVYHLAAEVADGLYATPFPRGFSGLRDQGLRASQSVVLNIVEGASRTGNARKNHYRIAIGSAGEVFAVLRLAPLDNREELQHKTRRVAAMLQKLAR